MSLFLKRFQIEELFGTYDVDIPFENNINIFVGENGIGKTTILNCINYVLQCDSDNLYNIDFKRIIITFGTGKIVEINHNDIITDKMLDLENRRRHWYAYDEENEIKIPSTISVIRKIYRELKNENMVMDITECSLLIVRTLRQRYNIDVSRFQVEKTLNEINEKSNLYWEEIIENEINENIIYLPTYRRIEEDFNKCTNIDYRTKNEIMKRIPNMQFGMNDVEMQIKNTCEELKTTTSEAFKEMTSNLLKSYVNIYSKKRTKTKKFEIDPDKLVIVFERLADKIGENVKKSIINFLIKENNIDELGYAYLVSIIECLQDIYEKTKEIDECLDRFTRVCNGYLESKTFMYNPFKIECELLQEHSGENIEFKNLSSGEKQIVSLFSRIYLTTESKNIILFDEPELSLSIAWQERLIPDIIESQKCNFIMVITHSPFIFDNEYKYYAKDIKSYITPIKEKI